MYPYFGIYKKQNITTVFTCSRQNFNHLVFFEFISSLYMEKSQDSFYICGELRKVLGDDETSRVPYSEEISVVMSSVNMPSKRDDRCLHMFFFFEPVTRTIQDDNINIIIEQSLKSYYLL